MMTTVTYQRFSATPARWIQWRWGCDTMTSKHYTTTSAWMVLPYTAHKHLIWH